MRTIYVVCYSLRCFASRAYEVKALVTRARALTAYLSVFYRDLCGSWLLYDRAGIHKVHGSMT